jgi:hypothetical protein
MDNSKLQDLLLESIVATNRTTHAVRALVLFIFIQLVGITMAVFLNTIATASVNPLRCAGSGQDCEPNVGLQVIAALIWIVAVVWSSYVGWSEISLSDPRADSSALSTSTSSYSKNSSSALESDNSFTSGNEKCKHCGTEKDWAQRPRCNCSD